MLPNCAENAAKPNQPS